MGNHREEKPYNYVYLRGFVPGTGPTLVVCKMTDPHERYVRMKCVHTNLLNDSYPKPLRTYDLFDWMSHDIQDCKRITRNDFLVLYQELLNEKDMKRSHGRLLSGNPAVPPSFEAEKLLRHLEQ